MTDNAAPTATQPADPTAAATSGVPTGYAEFVPLKKRPVYRPGQQPIAAIHLREPTAGDLRGLALPDVLNMQQQAMATLLPRISWPALTPAEYARLHVQDYTALAVKVVGFFVETTEAEAAQD